MKLNSIRAIVCLLLAATGIVQAQDEKARNQLHTLGGPFIVYRTLVKEELKLSDDQKQKLLENLPGYLQETAKVQEKDLKAGEKQSIRQQSSEKFWSFLKETLNAEQLKRFQQLELQHEGPSALLGRPQVAKELSITDEQRHQLMAVVQNMQKQFASLMKGVNASNRQEIRIKATEVYTEAEAKVEAILSETQRKQWKELVGEPFDVFNDN